jgi:hypothetical protein
LPVGKGQPYLNGNGIASEALGGWQISLTEQIQDGEPLAVGTANINGVNALGQNAILRKLCAANNSDTCSMS